MPGPSQKKNTHLISYQATPCGGQSTVRWMLARTKVVETEFALILREIDELQVRARTMHAGAFPKKKHAFDIISSNPLRWAKHCTLDAGSDKSCRDRVCLDFARNRRIASPSSN